MYSYNTGHTIQCTYEYKNTKINKRKEWVDMIFVVVLFREPTLEDDPRILKIRNLV